MVDLDAAQRLVRCALHGPVPAQQMIETMRSVHADPLFGPDFDVILDLRDFSGEWTLSDLWDIARAAREHCSRPGVRRAIVVSDEWQQELVKPLQAATLLSPVIYRPFHSIEAAEEWLNERRRTM
jgi:hypothetical protein